MKRLIAEILLLLVGYGGIGAVAIGLIFFARWLELV